MRPNEIFPNRHYLLGMDVLMPYDWSAMTNFTTLTLQQVRDYHQCAVPHLSMETVFTIPNWHNGNQQQYVKQADGTWIDCYNEVTVTEEFVMARIKENGG
jgi:hypothetical protein